MKTFASHITTLFALVALLATAPLAALAQNTVEQNQSTVLSVRREAGVNYVWDLYSADTKEFARTPGNVPTSSAIFLGRVKAGHTVAVAWLKEGTYFFKVTASYTDGRTNNIKVGKMVVVKSIPTPPKATDDNYHFKCEPIKANILINDVLSPEAFRTNIRLIKPSWDVQGEFKLNQQGVLEYNCEKPVANTVDSIRYEVQNIFANHSPMVAIATIRMHIGNIDCLSPNNPKATDDNYTIACGANKLDVTANDSYNTELDIQIEVIEWPIKGKLEYLNDTQVSYVPDSGAHGVDYFKYEIYYKDYPNRTDQALVTLNIPNDLNCDEDTTYTLFIPEAFTPNGDGVHDTWVVDGIELHPHATMAVYTRSGMKVFEQKNYGNAEYWGKNRRWWDGTDKNGKPVVAGVYLYTFKTSKKLIRGFVMVAYGKGQIGNQ